MKGENALNADKSITWPIWRLKMEKLMMKISLAYYKLFTLSHSCKWQLAVVVPSLILIYYRLTGSAQYFLQKKIDKRGRKLIDFDKERHNVQQLASNPNRNEGKFAR